MTLPKKGNYNESLWNIKEKCCLIYDIYCEDDKNLIEDKILVDVIADCPRGLISIEGIQKSN